MNVIYLDNEVIGKLSKEQTLEEFLKQEFIKQNKLVEMGYQKTKNLFT